MRRKPARGGGGSSDLYPRIYDLVRMIPEGCVATYGQIAGLAGAPTPRIVGFAMSAVPEDAGVPWHRVLNREGRISLPEGSAASLVQRKLLEAEGVRFDARGRIDLDRFGWPGPGPASGRKRR